MKTTVWELHTKTTNEIFNQHEGVHKGCYPSIPPKTKKTFLKKPVENRAPSHPSQMAGSQNYSPSHLKKKPVGKNKQKSGFNTTPATYILQSQGIDII